MNCQNFLSDAVFSWYCARRASLDGLSWQESVAPVCVHLLQVCRSAVSLSWPPPRSDIPTVPHSGLLWQTSAFQLETKNPSKLFYKCDSVRTNTMWMCCKMDLQKRSADVLDSSIFFCFGTCEPFVSHWFTTLNETNICLCGNSSTSAAFGLRFKNCAQKTYVYFNHSQNIHLLCPTFCFTSRVIERVQCFLWINEPQQVPYGCLQPCAKLEV